MQNWRLTGEVLPLPICYSEWLNSLFTLPITANFSWTDLIDQPI